MAFQDIAINDGCMAGQQFGRNVVPGFDLGQVLKFFDLDGETVPLQIRYPARAATSSWRLVDKNGHVTRLIRAFAVRDYPRAGGDRDDGEQAQENQLSHSEFLNPFFSNISGASSPKTTGRFYLNY